MGWNIIVASNDADQLVELYSCAKEIAARLTPSEAHDLSMAVSVEDLIKRRRLDQPACELLIVAASLPQRRAAAAVEYEPALNFIRSLGREANPPACILVSPRWEHLGIVQGVPRSELFVLEDLPSYVEKCLQLAQRLRIIGPAEPPGSPPAPMPALQLVDRSAGGPAAGPPPAAGEAPPPALAPAPPNPGKYALLEVDLLKDPKAATVRLEIHDGGEVTKRRSRPLRLKETQVEELMSECKKLKKDLGEWQRDDDAWNKNYNRWHPRYRTLGERVSDLLWGSRGFIALYKEGAGETPNNVRVRFNLEQAWFDGLWEALNEEEGRRPLMLQDTVVRRALREEEAGIFTRETGQIDASGGVLKILVIKSGVPAGATPEGPDTPLWVKFWSSFGGRLAELRYLDQEVDLLRGLKRTSKRGQDGPKIEVEVDVLPQRVPPIGKPWSLAKAVKNWLKDGNRRYDIVHFAGHALFDDAPRDDDAGDGSRGYLIFSGYPNPQAVSIATVASWFANVGVQLVYLSCCRSNASSTALEFARNNIPMAIGFHWDLNDRKAPICAERFYEELLASDLKVCRAIRNARLGLYNTYKEGDPIWASPVLIAQPIDWFQVEPALKLAANDRDFPAPPPSRPRRGVGPPRPLRRAA